jgi:cytochrome c6
VLKSVDRLLAPLVWLAAAAAIVMLLIGPQVVAEDKAQPAAGGKIDARAVFTQRCGACHTLSAAGTSGAVGPALDGISLPPEGIEEIVRSGTGSMPAFEGQLSDAEITALAKFVAGGGG